MTQAPHSLTDLSQTLAQAWTEGQVLPAADWTACMPDSASAYAVQDQLATRLGWASGQQAAKFWKSGGASRSSELSHATLAPAGVRISPASFADLGLRAPGIEAEIALRIGVDISAPEAAQLSHAQAMQLVDAFAVSAELVSSRWAEAGEAPALLRQADCLSHGALALGPWQAFDPQQPPDWAALSCWIQRNDEAPLRASGSHPLGDPTWLLPTWLRHLSRNGASIQAGTVVTTGAWLVLSGLQAGDQVSLGFDGLGELQIAL